MKRIVYNYLRFIRYFYYRFFKKRFFQTVKLYCNLSVLRILTSKYETFFGYYNISPENKNGEILLGRVEDNRTLIIYLIKDKIIKVGETKSWNWQQGCMLQWSPLRDNILYYNSYDENSKSYFTTIHDTSNGKIEKLDFPICCISKDESFALSLNFERLSIMRPDYGYFCNEEISLSENNNIDGIWKIDLLTKKVRLIISLQQLIDLFPVETMIGANHKVNHIDISPNGKRFMFLHRWIGPKGRFMRLITASNNGDDIYILNGDIMTSHSCWYGNDRIISFCNTDKYGDSYIIFKDKTNIIKKVSDKLPTVDGHPSVSPDGNWLITDTYPHYDRMSYLYLINLKTGKIINVGRFYQPLKFSGYNRIDLHPKWNIDGCKIYFESGHNGKRNLYSIDLKEIIFNGGI